MNPVGNAWAYLCASRPAISLCETCADIVARCCDAWTFFVSDITTLRPIAARDSTKAVNV